ncbi:MAG: glycosyltransferase [Saprospiraceae bacterium]|nr:glycosyltransferase [Saprospiraceae bacterium]
MTKKVLILTYWGYKETLISNFTIPYIQSLHQVNPKMNMFLFTLNKKHQSMSSTDIENANKKLSKFKTQLLAFNYSRFGIKAILKMVFLIWKLIRIIKKEKITHIHAFCSPAGAIGYLLKLFSNVILVLDSYEPHAESMVESGQWKPNGLAFKLLFFLEKQQTKKADFVISLTEEMYQYAKKKYGIQIQNFYIKPSCIDVNKFKNPDYIKNAAYINKLKLKNKIIGLYAGKFGGLYLEDEIFDIIKVAYNKWKDTFHMIILGGIDEKYLNKKAAERGIPGNVITKEFVSAEELAYYMGLADFALTPVKPTPSKRYCSPIKNGEYWVLGLPVIITKGISDDSDIIKSKNIGYVLKDLTEKEYNNALNWLDTFIKKENILELKKGITEFGIYNRSMERAESVYKKIYSIE